MNTITVKVDGFPKRKVMPRLRALNMLLLRESNFVSFFLYGRGIV